MNIKDIKIQFKLISTIVCIIFVSVLLCSDMLRVKSSLAAELNLPASTELLPLSDSHSMPTLKAIKLDPKKSIKHIVHCGPG